MWKQKSHVVFFQSDGLTINGSFIVMLRQDHLEESFLELKTHIKNAVDALVRVDPENYGNSGEILELLKGNVRDLKYLKVVKTSAKAIALSVLPPMAKKWMGIP